MHEKVRLQRTAALLQARSQLDNLFELLKAYPSVKLKIGGCTDGTGAAAADRSYAVMRWLPRADGRDAPFLRRAWLLTPLRASSGQSSCAPSTSANRYPPTSP
jgi:hypothetical protein